MNQKNNIKFQNDVIPIDQWQNTNYTFGLGLPNLTNEIKKKEDIMEYAMNYDKMMKETNFVNENKNKLWIWKNLAIIISTGVILDKNDQLILNEIISYFDSSQTCFLPCQFKILNYEDETIKIIEENYGIQNGNYHFILIPFILTDNKNNLNNAPESLYKKFGPVFVYQNMESITDYMIDLYSKYGAVNLQISNNVNGQLTTGSTRSGEILTNNWMTHGDDPKRINRKGYIDLESSQWNQLVDPEQNYLKLAPSKHWGTDENEINLLDQNTTYRRNLSNGHYRENPNLNLGWLNKDGYNQNNTYRIKSKNNLYNQLHQERIKNAHVDEAKGVHYKMNDYYESESNKIEKPNYQLYDVSNDDFIDTILARETNVPTNWN